MLMRALGYFQYQNDYADGFELSTVRQGTKIRIFDGVGSSATEPMTRNQVAQMVLNALQTGMVEPDGNTTTFLNPDGTVLATTGKVNYVSVTSNKDFARAISALRATSIGSTNEGYIVELGERLYDGKLELVNWYIELLESGSEKYIVPQSKAYLERVRDELIECHKQIMKTQITSPGERPILDIKYPKGYEG